MIVLVLFAFVAGAGTALSPCVLPVLPAVLASGGRGEGFWSGILVGAGLGFVYAPCAGPILAAVVSVSATQGASGELLAVALGYAAGSALVLLLVAYGGRRLLDPARPAGRRPGGPAARPPGRGGAPG